MSTDHIPELPSAESAPNLGDMRRIGTPAEQIAWLDTAWTMLEPYDGFDESRLLPSGIVPATRLSNEWLGRHGWKVVLVEQHDLAWSDPFVAPLAKELQRRGIESLVGVPADPDDGQRLHRYAVWEVPSNEDGIERFSAAHYDICHMLIPRDLSFAIHADHLGIAAYAGPRDFLLAALPPEVFTPEGWEKLLRGMDTLDEGVFGHTLRHYGPFLFQDR